MNTSEVKGQINLHSNNWLLNSDFRQRFLIASQLTAIHGEFVLLKIAEFCCFSSEKVSFVHCICIFLQQQSFAHLFLKMNIITSRDTAMDLCLENSENKENSSPPSLFRKYGVSTMYSIDVFRETIHGPVYTYRV